MNTEELKKFFAGKVILPGDPEYDQAVSTMAGKKGTPVVVLRPSDASGVAGAVKFAQDNGLAIAVKGGGHSVGAYGTNDGGLVIDMSGMSRVEMIDEGKHLVRVGAGATWAQVAETLKPHGLAISSGDTKSVGVAGLTLGAGVGWMVRKHGLAIDQLRGAEIVTADGRVLRLNEGENSDLFWAIRGGGGNFGVVTSFDFEAHPTGKVFAGMIIYAFEDVEQAIKSWRDAMRAAPEELTTMLLAMAGFPPGSGNPSMLMTLNCYAGDDESAANAALDPIRKIGKVTQDMIKLKDYADVLEEAHPPGGIKAVVNNAAIDDFSDEAIASIAGMFKDGHGPVLQIRSVGGAMGRVATEATAFAHRKAEVIIVCPTFVQPAATQDEINEALKPWQSIARFSNGAYVNFVSEEGGTNIEAVYPPATLDRLRQVKAKYDPSNVFCRNYNIKVN